MAATRERDIDREQVEQVFGLTGGELDAAPRRMLALRDGYWKRTRLWVRHTYDGLPEYAAGDFPGRWDHDFFTAVWNAGDYGSHRPPRALYRGGKLYRLVRTYGSSGETACPGRTLHECSGREDHPTVDDDGRKVSVVRRAEARLSPSWRSIGTNSSRPLWWKGRRAECPLCEARVGSAHGFIYLGAGWCEAVYRERPAREEEA